MKRIAAFCGPFCAAPAGLAVFFVPDPYASTPGNTGRFLGAPDGRVDSGSAHSGCSGFAAAEKDGKARTPQVRQAPMIGRRLAAQEKNGPVSHSKGLSDVTGGKYFLSKGLWLSSPFCVSYRLRNAETAAQAARRPRAGRAIDAYIDPAHKEWRISHPFPQKTRKWMGHGRSISGPGQ
jgi:hypothetical protein